MKPGYPHLIFFIMTGWFRSQTLFSEEIRISGPGGSTLAYISDDGRIENSARTSIGYVDVSGRVENASRSTLGYMEGDRVENASRTTVLTFSGPFDYKKIGAYIFFFNPVLKKK